MDATTRIPLEMLYGVLLPIVTATRNIDQRLYIQAQSLVVELARVLGKPCPVQTRADRRAERAVLR